MSVAVADTGGAPRAIWRRGILASRKGRWGFGILTALALIAIFAPLLAPHDPNAIDASRILAPPNLAHPFGSDALGRDVLSRVLFAYRVSLSVAVVSTLLAFVVGVPLGLYAGYHGGWVDTAIMRPIDMVLALPAMLLAVALIAIIGPGSNVATLSDRGDLHADPRSRRPGLDLGRGVADLHRVGEGARFPTAGDHHAARAAERDRSRDRAGDDPDGLRAADRSGALVPGARRPASHLVLGRDARPTAATC